MNKLKRYIVFLIWLLINSLGVSFVTKANLWTSPISSIPYTLSLSFKPTLGQFTIYFLKQWKKQINHVVDIIKNIQVVLGAYQCIMIFV